MIRAVDEAGRDPIDEGAGRTTEVEGTGSLSRRLGCEVVDTRTVSKPLALYKRTITLRESCAVPIPQL